MGNDGIDARMGTGKNVCSSFGELMRGFESSGGIFSWKGLSGIGNGDMKFLSLEVSKE